MGNRFKEVQTEGNVLLRKQIEESKGRFVTFSNGCWLSLRSEDGHICGTNPYGQDWFCNAVDGWEDSVLRWLSYWDSSRDETGSRLKPIQSV